MHAQDPKDLAALRVTLPAVPVPTLPGLSYHCMAVPAPTQRPKYHVLRYEVRRTRRGSARRTSYSSPLRSFR